MTEIVIDQTLQYRMDDRTVEQFATNLRNGHNLEALVAKRIIDGLGNSGISVEFNPCDEVNASPDLTLTGSGGTLKIELQSAVGHYYKYSGSEKPEYAKFSKMGPVFHVKEHKFKELANFEKTSTDSNKRYGYLCHTVGTASNHKIYLLHYSNIGAVYGQCACFGGKWGYVVPVSENLVDARLLDSVIPGMRSFLRPK